MPEAPSDGFIWPKAVQAFQVPWREFMPRSRVETEDISDKPLMASLPNSECRAPDPAPRPAERRVQRRLFWPGTAVVRILPYGPDVLGVLLDLNESGCGVEIGIAIPAQVGDQVEVELHVRGVALERAGVIRYIDVIRRTERETRAGIEFIEPCSRRTAQIDRSVKGVLRQVDRSRMTGR